jgi:cytoskeleton protein RodZ
MLKVPCEKPVEPAASMGARLREARSRAQLTAAQLHEKTRVPMEAISALEEDRIEDLPASVYTRGFVKLLCGELKLPYDEFVALLPASSPLPSRVSLSLFDAPTAARDGADKEEEKQSRVSTALVLFILVVLASLAISYFASQKERENLQTPSASEVPHLDVTG